MTARSRCSRSRRLIALAVGLLVSVLGAGPAAATGVPQQAPPGYAPHDQLQTLGADRAWRLTTGAEVVVAVLDSGVDAEHPDLAGRVLPGQDFVDGTTDGREDVVGHGTTVASLIAGGGEPVIGLAPEAIILPVRVLDEENRYQQASTIADGVRWAVDQGADVINLSLGGPRDSEVLADAIAYAIANDVVVVACTGNQGAEEEYREVWYPAREPGVVAVTGITYEAGVPVAWPASLIGPESVISAPAVVTGSATGGGRRSVQGTSFASALVAGAAALLRARSPELSAAEVVHRLVATAEDLGEPGRDPEFGFGALNPVAALTASVPSVPINPLDTKARHGVTGFGTAPGQSWELTQPSPADRLPRRTIGFPAGVERFDPRSASPEPAAPADQRAAEGVQLAGRWTPLLVVPALVALAGLILASRRLGRPTE